MGLGRLVQLDKGPFVGQVALRAEHGRPPSRRIVGLEISWDDVEAAYTSYNLPPSWPAAASRVAVPLYDGRQQVGKATSTTWSPVLKKLIALATVESKYIELGSKLEYEITVEATRHRVAATVIPTPFFNPPRKTAVPVLG